MQPVSHTRGVTQPQNPTGTPEGHGLRRWVAAAVVIAGLVSAFVLWSVPRDQVAVPGPEATPEQVVAAYLAAVNVRDFDTANAIEGRPGQDLAWFSRPMQSRGVKIEKTVKEGSRWHVLFQADFEGGDGTVQDGLWGYYLERDGDGQWQIVDAGVV